MPNKHSWGEILSDSNSFQMDINKNSILKVERTNNELLISNMIQDDQITEHRIIINHDRNIFLQPGLPDLPVVIKPSENLSIFPGQVFSTYIEVPLAFQILCGTNKNRLLLREYSSLPLSRSWFGDPDSGEIAYFLESPMNTDIQSCSSDYPCIHCPVTITNKTNQILSLERMILRVPYLSIYKGESRFYTNRTKINYKGPDQISQINILKTPPDVHEKLAPAIPPRKAIDSSVLHKSFYFIKTLYNG